MKRWTSLTLLVLALSLLALYVYASATGVAPYASTEPVSCVQQGFMCQLAVPLRAGRDLSVLLTDLLALASSHLQAVMPFVQSSVASLLQHKGQATAVKAAVPRLASLDWNPVLISAVLVVISTTAWLFFWRRPQAAGITEEAATGERLAKDMLDAESIKLRAITDGMTSPGASVQAVEVELCRFLDEYDLKVPSGAFKYKKAAEFLMNTIIIGSKGIVSGIVQARDQAVQRAQTAEAAITQLRAEVTHLSDADSRASSSHAELLSAQQEVARLTGQVEAKDRHAASLERELRQLRQQQSQAATAQQAQQQELDVAKAEVARLQGQLGAARRLQTELEGLRAQLTQAAQRETALQQEKAAAEQEAQHKASQLASVQQTVERLQQQVSAGQSKQQQLNARLAQLNKELQEARSAAENVQVADSRLLGELEEERKKVTGMIKELADLSKEKANLATELVNERVEHDKLKVQVAAMKSKIINKDIDPQTMTIPQLKSWVTDNSVEDDEFLKMSQSSRATKPEWISYVKKKLQQAGA